MQESLLKIRYFERIIKKPLKFNLKFSFAPVPFYGQYYKKQKGHGISYQSLFGLQKMFRKKYFVF